MEKQPEYFSTTSLLRAWSHFPQFHQWKAEIEDLGKGFSVAVNGDLLDVRFSLAMALRRGDEHNIEEVAKFWRECFQAYKSVQLKFRNQE